MTNQRPRLVKQLIDVLNNPDTDRDIQEELDLILTPIHLPSMTKDQKNKITRLHDFIYKYYDGEAKKTVVMYQLVLSVIRSLKPSFPAQYELHFWTNKIMETLETPDRTALLHQTRAALQAKMAWPVEADEAWTGSGDTPGYIMLEELLTLMYNRVIQTDTLSQRDIQTFHMMCYTLLSAL